jgi:protein gp37
MASTSTAIEWTHATWNPVRGCSRVSEGCRHCYAERQAIRHAGAGRPYEGLVRKTPHGPQWTGQISFVEHALLEPLRWRDPRLVFVNSMSDLFHERVAVDQIALVFAAMAAAPQHGFQVLTKRASRMLEVVHRLYDNGGALVRIAADLLAAEARACHLGQDGWTFPLPNVWLGVSVEDQARADERIPYLLGTPAAVRFVSAEPLLGPVDLTRVVLDEGVAEDVLGDADLRADPKAPPCLDWVIVGGESGPRARPFDLAWARQMVATCLEREVPIFVKQLGAQPFDSARVGEMQDVGLADRKGGDPAEWPADLRVRQMPGAHTMPAVGSVR